jgi:predicted RNase H-like nuclease (RuvC/YqgF family)
VLARERERRSQALAGALRRERDRIGLYERRVNKLRSEVERMEHQIAELAQRAELDPGLPSIYRTVQGLSKEESDREAKAHMLAVLFQQNLVLQQRGA